MTDSASATRRGPWPRRVALACAVVLGLVVIAAAWIGIRGAMAKSELEALLPLVQPLREAAADGDVEALVGLTGEAHEHAAQAAQLTGDPVWRAAESLPWVGANLAAVRIVSSSVDAMTAASLPLLDLVETATTADGSFDMTILLDAHEPLVVAADAFTKAEDDLSTVDPAALIPQVANGVDEVAAFAAEAAPALSSASETVAVLPELVGLNGPRTYLIALQNSAELRTGGGIMGSFILIDADGGELSIVEQADSTDFPSLDTPIVDLPADATTLEGDDLGRFVQNASLTPDFSLTAELARAWWSRYSTTAPDGVVSIDLPVVAALLGVSGPFALDDGSVVDSDNLLERLLVEPYLTLNGDEQTAFQRTVTTAALDHILSNGIDPLAWMKALAVPADQGRISLWSADAKAQKLIDSSSLGGPLVRLTKTPGDGYAVYLNDVTAGKMDNFLDLQIASGWAMCRSDKHADVTIAVTLTNTAPPSAASWPWRMTGGGSQGISPGDIGTDITVAAPPGTFFGGVRTTDGTLLQARNADVSGYPSSRERVVLSPGESKTLEFRFVAAETGDQDVRVLHTPLMKDITPTQADVTCDCQSFSPDSTIRRSSGEIKREGRRR